MRVLNTLSVTQILVEWGISEGLGRFRKECPKELLQLLESPEPQEAAIHVLVNKRVPLLFLMLYANPRQFVQIEITPDDRSKLKILGKPPVALPLAASSPTQRPAQDNAYIENLIQSRNECKGPLLAFSRGMEGPFTLFDGVHRAIAWIQHAEQWKSYPLVMNLVISEKPVSGWE